MKQRNGRCKKKNSKRSVRRVTYNSMGTLMAANWLSMGEHVTRKNGVGSALRNIIGKMKRGDS